MSESPIENLLPRLESRREYFDYLDGWQVGEGDTSRTRSSSRAMTKAFLLETSPTNNLRDARTALSSGGRVGLEPVDESLFRMRWQGDSDDWALLEIENERYPIIYTEVQSEVANRRINRLVNRSALLDRAWLSPSMFLRLWKIVEGTYSSHRFSQIVFEHESVFQQFEENSPGYFEDDEDQDVESSEDERPQQVERRRARMQITERIGMMQQAVLPWEERYAPLASIVRLRIPAPVKGGHDVFFDGRFTNRSDSTTSFRQTVSDVMRLYHESTTRVETAAWPTVAEEGVGLPRFIGAPLLIQFSEPLDFASFGHWISTLRRKRNRFRLWGTPLVRGSGKVHLYAIDNHLWQPIDLEITRNHVYALLPAGTCGNTIHRLVTNIQRFVQPKVSAFIGEQRYEDFIDNTLGRKMTVHGE